MKVRIELEKTLQVRQFEPLRVMISAEDDITMDKVPELYKELSGKLSSMLKREYEKYDQLTDRTVKSDNKKSSVGSIPALKKKKVKVISAEY